MKSSHRIVPVNEKVGWRKFEWSGAVGLSDSCVDDLIAREIIESVKVGAALIITTPPADFLAAVRDAGGVIKIRDTPRPRPADPDRQRRSPGRPRKHPALPVAATG